MENWFTSKTKLGRVNRTILQSFIGIFAMFTALFAIPEFQTWFGDLPLVVQIGGLSVVIGGVSALQNYSKSLWEKVKDL